MTIREIVDFLNKNTSAATVPEEPAGGNFSQTCTGVVFTSLPSSTAATKARDLGANLVVACEPTHWGRKALGQGHANIHPHTRSLIEDAGIVVWQLPTTGTESNIPDVFHEALLEELRYRDHMEEKDARICSLPPRSLEQIATEAKANLGIDSVRMVGNPESCCQRIAVFAGWAGADNGLQMEHLTNRNCDAVICGGTTEWTVCNYVRDAAELGHAKGLVVLGIGHSLAPGLQALARQLMPVVPHLKVQYAPGNPFLDSL